VSTIDKALSLLTHFSERRPALGLTQIAGLAQYDKATTRRMLLALSRCGFVEQDRETREYRLGPALVQLARLREAAFPIEAVVSPVLRRLSEASGETAHFSLASAGALATMGLAESERAHRVRLEWGEKLPLHATASGIAYLAFAPPEALAVLDAPLRAYTSKTVTDSARVRTRVNAARQDGWAVSRDGFEEGVFGLAAPIIGRDRFAIGAIAVAAPASRVSVNVERRIRALVVAASREIAQALGGATRRVAA
jgi:DNA-binding IclR family transcriptional regulator